MSGSSDKIALIILVSLISTMAIVISLIASLLLYIQLRKDANNINIGKELGRNTYISNVAAMEKNVVLTTKKSNPKPGKAADDAYYLSFIDYTGRTFPCLFDTGATYSNIPQGMLINGFTKLGDVDVKVVDGTMKAKAVRANADVTGVWLTDKSGSGKLMLAPDTKYIVHSGEGFDGGSKGDVDGKTQFICGLESIKNMEANLVNGELSLCSRSCSSDINTCNHTKDLCQNATEYLYTIPTGNAHNVFISFGFSNQCASACIDSGCSAPVAISEDIAKKLNLDISDIHVQGYVKVQKLFLLDDQNHRVDINNINGQNGVDVLVSKKYMPNTCLIGRGVIDNAQNGGVNLSICGEDHGALWR